jgi:hypothetical protein
MTYYSNGLRDVTYGASRAAINEGVVVDDFPEGCYSQTVLMPGHQFDITDGNLHSGGPAPDAQVCADKRLTPSDFSRDPYALGEPGVVTVRS